MGFARKDRCKVLQIQCAANASRTAGPIAGSMQQVPYLYTRMCLRAIQGSAKDKPAYSRFRHAHQPYTCSSSHYLGMAERMMATFIGDGGGATAPCSK